MDSGRLLKKRRKLHDFNYNKHMYPFLDKKDPSGYDDMDKYLADTCDVMEFDCEDSFLEGNLKAHMDWYISKKQEIPTDITTKVLLRIYERSMPDNYEMCNFVLSKLALPRLERL
eukprot:753167-Hanusia_phi.AAC.1